MAEETRQLIARFLEMSRSPAASQSTIQRNEEIRIQTAVLVGYTDNAASTIVFIPGVKTPVMLMYHPMIEQATDNWVGYDYREGATPGDDFEFIWRGPAHGTAAARNSFLFNSVGVNCQGKKYRIFCIYTDRI